MLYGPILTLREYDSHKPSAYPANVRLNYDVIVIVENPMPGKLHK